MDFDQLAKWSVTAIPVVGLVFLFFQVRLQRGQHRLQDAEAHAQQAAAWAALEDDWDIALLVAKGRSAVYRFGVTLSKEKAFLATVERYVQARVKFLDVQHEGSTPEDWESYETERVEAQEALAPYQRSIQRVITHLAQVSGLVLRGRLSLEVAYDALGLAVLRVGDEIRDVMREGYAHNSSCPGPQNAELDLWRRLHVDQAVPRLGWGDFLEVARGTAERISLFLDLLTVHGLTAGDIGPHAHNFTEQTPGEWLSDPDRLAVAWRAARHGGFLRAIRFTARLARAGRRARRLTFHHYPKWVQKLADRISGNPLGHALPNNGWLKAPLDITLVWFDVARAKFRSRKVPDIRRLDDPHTAGRQLEVAA